MALKKLPNYKNPPVTEVVFGAIFDPLPEFKTAHFGLLWGKIEEEFPRCDDVPPILLTPPQPDEWPPPRVWYINEIGDRVIQIQNDRFYYNWRRREGTYPRYGKVFSEFQDKFDTLIGFVEENELGQIHVNGLELTYINQISFETDRNETPRVSEVFPDFSVRQNSERYLPSPRYIRAISEYEMGEYGTLSANIRPGTRKIDGVPILILELAARSSPTMLEEINAEKWFAMAHEWIVFGFEDLTDMSIQKRLWRKQ